MPINTSVKVNTVLPPLTVETLVNGGHGLARHNGRVVFIPHAAVGDVVECRVTKTKKKFLEAEIFRVIEAAVQRRTPLCPHAGECGGCQWQHLPYPEQLSWKENLFRDSLVRQCRIGPDKVLPIAAAPHEWGYRSRIQLKCKQEGKRLAGGFYRAKSHHIVAIESCPLMAPQLNELFAALRDFINASSVSGVISHIDLAIDDRAKRVAVIHYHGESPESFTRQFAGAEFCADILIKAPSERALISVRGDGILTIDVGQPPLSLNYRAGSFAQINLEQNRFMVERILELAALHGDETVVDLFCGMGNFSLPLARQAGEVVGFEVAEDSVAMAKANCQRHHIDNATFHCAPADGVVSRFGRQQQIDLVVLDPPRSGAPGVMHELIDSQVDRIIYVSCDSQTLARDLKVLVNGGYELVSSQPVDMFPQTYHCESISLLRRLT